MSEVSPGAGLRALQRMAAAQAARDREGLEREMARVAAAVASGDLRALQVEEALLQSCLFLGFPASLDALERWRRVGGQAAPPPADEGTSTWRTRGLDVCRRVYGSQVEGLRRNIASLHPDIAEWMVDDGYGKVLGRGGLDLRDRELLIAAQLAVQDAPRQLYSHLRGALRNGATEGQVEAMLDEIEPWLDGAGVRDRVRKTWDVVRGAGRGSASEGTHMDAGIAGIEQADEENHVH
ncbi:MAG: carboxymuconolactone decarboxylase family protein [Gemmatimonadales bacterium]|nr:MAG: carboxymuconolactone decarboxylase family protein [Gemmatimonadales bacterium]